MNHEPIQNHCFKWKKKTHTRRTLCTSSVHKHTSSHSLAHYDFEQEKIVHNKRINVAFLASFFKKEKEGERERKSNSHSSRLRDISTLSYICFELKTTVACAFICSLLLCAFLDDFSRLRFSFGARHMLWILLISTVIDIIIIFCLAQIGDSVGKFAKTPHKRWKCEKIP